MSCRKGAFGSFVTSDLPGMQLPVHDFCSSDVKQQTEIIHVHYYYCYLSSHHSHTFRSCQTGSWLDAHLAAPCDECFLPWCCKNSPFCERGNCVSNACNCSRSVHNISGIAVPCRHACARACLLEGFSQRVADLLSQGLIKSHLLWSCQLVVCQCH